MGKRNLTLMLCCWLFVYSAEGQDIPKGKLAEEFIYPLKRFSFINPRYVYTNLEDDKFSESYQLRTMATFGRTHLRFDIPAVRTNTTNDGKTEFGMGDISFKVIAPALQSNRFFYGGTMLLSFPTASNRYAGSGKYMADPGLGFILFKPQDKGMYSFVIDYAFDYAGHSDRAGISVLGLAPNIDWWFKWGYVGYYPVWTYNFHSKMWDIPLDVEVAYQVFKKLMVMVEYVYPLLKEKSYQSVFYLKLRTPIMQKYYNKKEARNVRRSSSFRLPVNNFR